MNREPNWKDWLITALIVIIGVLGIYIVESKFRHNRYDVPTSNEKVDSLLQSNDSIKQVVINLDSAKKYEIQKVNTLGRDSTIELFKELVSE